MFQTLKNAFMVKEIRRKILITLFLLVVYRFGCWLPVVGVDTSLYLQQINKDTILGLLSAISGGALRNGSVLALGISPYINASIIMQLLTVAIKRLEEWSKQGEEGKRKISQWTRILTLVLALAQSIGIVISWHSNKYIQNVFGLPANWMWLVSTFVVIILVAGSSFTMWLGEKITELNIGNGISLLIFVGILATAGQSLIASFSEISGDNFVPLWEIIGFLVMVVVVFGIIVFFDNAERRIPIQYAKQVKGRKMYGGQSTYIPIKVNASGVLPIIFAMAIWTFPQIIIQLFWPESSFYAFWMQYLGAGSIVYVIATSLLIFGFAFFYAQIQFNPEEVSRNIQQYGGFITGIRPGLQTTEYLAKVSRRLTLFGAVFLAFIALVPGVIFAAIIPNGTLVNAFSSTGMLIVVSVALEFDKQLEAQLMMKHYKGFLK